MHYFFYTGCRQIYYFLRTISLKLECNIVFLLLNVDIHKGLLHKCNITDWINREFITSLPEFINFIIEVTTEIQDSSINAQMARIVSMIMKKILMMLKCLNSSCTKVKVFINDKNEFLWLSLRKVWQRWLYTHII